MGRLLDPLGHVASHVLLSASLADTGWDIPHDGEQLGAPTVVDRRHPFADPSAAVDAIAVTPGQGILPATLAHYITIITTTCAGRRFSAQST